MPDSQDLLHAYMKLQTGFVRERQRHCGVWPLREPVPPLEMDRRAVDHIRELGAEAEAGRLAWLLALKAEGRRTWFSDGLAT